MRESDFLWDERYFILDGEKYIEKFRIFNFGKGEFFIKSNCWFLDKNRGCTYPGSFVHLSEMPRECPTNINNPHNRCPLRSAYEPWKDGIGEELK